LRNVETRGCKYGFDFSNITSTPPLVLNSQTGFFNNVIHFDKCIAQKGLANSIGFHIAGATIQMTACAAESHAIGVKVEGADFYGTTATIGEIYIEACSQIGIDVQNANLNLGTRFYGATTIPIAIKATSARVNGGYLRAYAPVTKGIESVDSFVTLKDATGSLSTIFTHSGTGRVRLEEREYAATESFDLDSLETADFVLNSQPGTVISVDVIVTVNGGAREAVKLIADNNLLYLPTTMPSNLGATLFTNVNGNRDLRLTNTAGFAFNLTGKVCRSPLDYTIAPPLFV
jgi:hypothetical protein